ncbi:MAG: DUF1570 domain-containing protein [Gemmatales bacterium]|nr:DUF1570 domain-containing protein [Gemmatales bacterium]MDW7994912.1 DUF1570 domain-containing protein [Gemmatales bacterium]
MLPSWRLYCSSRWTLLVLFLISVYGCAHTPSSLSDDPTLPQRSEVRIGSRYVVHSDIPLERGHPLLLELAELPERIRRELQWPDADSLVHVYIFRDRSSYERYVHAHFRQLPPRRALFVAQPSMASEEDLLVFAFWGTQILEDLRHELTHAELHSACPNLPLWLDEGLAEFFEVPAQHDGVHHRHLAALRAESSAPWTPSLKRLEKLTSLSDLTAQDYREAWAWTHFLLRSCPHLRLIFLQYLRDLRQATRFRSPTNSETPTSVSLAERLTQMLPSPERALLAHLDALHRQQWHLLETKAELLLESNLVVARMR